MSLRTVARAVLLLAATLAVLLMYRLVSDTASRTDIVTGTVALVVCATAAPIVALRWVDPPTSAMMILTKRRRSRRSGASGTLAYDWVGLNHMPDVMCLAAIAAEDAYFAFHSGFDWVSIREAREHNRTHTKMRGGSTISQQVAKNLFLWPGRSYLRKVIEALLTMMIEAVWPKRRILEVYLNIAQLGDDVFGVEAAAHRFFDKPARDISRHEAALLAAALPSPVTSPVGAPSHQLRFRQSWVLASMRRLGDTYLERL